jgi:hypothetical protein
MAQDNRSGDFLESLVNEVRANPIPAALIGMGVLWMFAGGSKTSLAGGGTALFGALGHGARAAGGAAYAGAGHLGSGVASGTSYVADTISRAASGAFDATRSVAGAVGDAVSSTTSRAGEMVSSAYDSVSDAYGKGSEAAEEKWDQLSHSPPGGARAEPSLPSWNNNLQKSIADAFERQPLLLGAVGLAIGAGMAAAVPITDLENKWAGEASDSVKEQAQDLFSAKVEDVKAMADRGLKAAAAQGLSPDTLGAGMRGVANKVTKVAEVAGDALKSRIEETTQRKTKS